MIGVVGGISAGGAGFYAVIAIGICRRMIGLSDNVSIFAIGLPFFIVLMMAFVKYLPGWLKKAGMLSDEPKRFGPWFKRDTDA
jgi:hypothetical protein